MKSSRLLRLLRWAEALGWTTTLANFGRIALSGHKAVLRAPGVSRGIHVRRNDSDVVMFEQVFVNRDYEFDLGFTPTLIVDAGANAGYASLFFHRKYPRARILAIEPDPANADTLRRNTAGIEAIRCIQGGLWNKRQPLRISDPSAPKCMVSLQPADKQGPDTVDGYSLTDIMQMAGTEFIDLLKIDIEGGEKDLFSENFEPWIGKVRVFMVELHDRVRPGCATALYAAVRHLRFTQHQKGDIVTLINEDLRPR